MGKLTEAQRRALTTAQQTGGIGWEYRRKPCAFFANAGSFQIARTNTAITRSPMPVAPPSLLRTGVRTMGNVTVKPQITDEMVEVARKAVEELANTRMELSMEDWSRISNAILAALVPPSDLSPFRQAQYDAYGAALSVPCLQEPDGWQPISTAPKDGTPILCLSPDYLSAGLTLGHLRRASAAGRREG